MIMKIQAFILLTSILTTNIIHSQNLPEKPMASEVRSYNQTNLMKIEIGDDKIKVVEKMGGIQTIQTYTKTGISLWTYKKVKEKAQVISNPYSRDLKKDKEGNAIEILWYYTDIKKVDDAITKDEQTPIILENNAVVGMGWGFYEDYAKRKEITIDVR